MDGEQNSIYDQQLQVRVKLNSNLLDEIERNIENKPQNEPQYIYNYRRIFSVVAVVIAVIVVMVVGAIKLINLNNDVLLVTDADTVNSFTEQEPTAAAAKLTQQSSELTSASIPEAIPETTPETIPKLAPVKTDDTNKAAAKKGTLQKEIISESKLLGQASKTDPAPNKIAIDKESATVNSVALAVEPSVKTAIIAPPKTPTVAAKKAKISAEVVAAVNKVNIKAVEKLSNRIVRAGFASSIRDNEPVGDGTKVVSGKNGIAKLLFYTETRGLKDQIITHTWFYEGKKVADIKIGVWNNQYRCYSSKYLTPGKTGKWRVEVQDEKGNRLAEGEFAYSRI